MMEIQFSKEFECLLDPMQVRIKRNGSGVETFLMSLAERFGFRYEAGSERFDIRQVSKYDTRDGFLLANSLHAKFITYEKGGKPYTKLALKSLSQIPELVMDQLENPKRNLVYPAGKFHEQSRLKVEQDLINDYSQHAISGTIWLEGKHAWPELGDIASYFPHLKKLKGYDASTPLEQQGTHQLLLIDNPAISVPTKKGAKPVDSSLELRFSNGELDLVEMSLRVIKGKGKWDRRLLAELTRIYARLHRSEVVATQEDYFNFYAFPLLSK